MNKTNSNFAISPPEQCFAMLDALKKDLTNPNQWNQLILASMRENSLSPFQLHRFMLQYYHYVRRFVGWLSLAIAHTNDDSIQALLLPNLADEINDPAVGKSHQRLLIDLLVGIVEAVLANGDILVSESSYANQRGEYQFEYDVNRYTLADFDRFIHVPR